MILELETYRECGKRAANAIGSLDNFHYNQEYEWFLAAKLREDLNGRVEADRAYHAAFNEARLTFRAAFLKRET